MKLEFNYKRSNIKPEDADPVMYAYKSGQEVVE
jgi:hypothetical protein